MGEALSAHSLRQPMRRLPGKEPFRDRPTLGQPAQGRQGRRTRRAPPQTLARRGRAREGHSRRRSRAGWRASRAGRARVGEHRGDERHSIDSLQGLQGLQGVLNEKSQGARTFFSLARK